MCGITYIYTVLQTTFLKGGVDQGRDGVGAVCVVFTVRVLLHVWLPVLDGAVQEQAG